ncbi:Mov34/MPN/PAD-1 family protein [Brevibacillus migulae]|uniref:Mov34/MPN/PAD-1 family protein n=1 Tax=Brevibacillus migulae TaxID=1644114 RepID=UPI00106E3C69|nr:Mov34/MPN/PAD-1 family protein [Brevibacillus migulae]
MSTLYITKSAWRQIEQAVLRDTSVETGGIMMGYPLGQHDWVITYASEPGPRAIHEPRSIYFDDQYLRRLVRRLNRRGAGKWRYIGDWHSHTVRKLSPSRGDKMTIWQKTVTAAYNSNSPLMLIAGVGKHNQVQARAFILANSLREIKQVSLIGRQELRQLVRTQTSLDANG